MPDSKRTSNRDHDDIAIVGMAAMFPKADSLRRFWQNLIEKVDGVEEGADDWVLHYYDPDSIDPARIYTKRAGFLDREMKFDPLEFGIMPNMVDGTTPDHFVALMVCREALRDAGYLDREFNREATGVILGYGPMANRGNMSAFQHGMVVDQTVDMLRDLLPDVDDALLAEFREDIKSNLPPLIPETVPGVVANVLTGRVANRLDLMGPNYVVDAACSSSLISIDCAINELRSGRSEMILAGGVNASLPPQMLMVFSLIQALSRGEVRPFDKHAEGVLLGEGAGVLALKRLADAERDGDRIYAVIKGMSLASDGKSKGLLAPRYEGEVLSMRRAYDETGIDTDTISLIEAHGTGIKLGDEIEIATLKSIFGKRGEQDPQVALGAVKSMIGHSLTAAGAAGLIKTALAIYHRVLPPTLCDEVDPELAFEETPFYVNNETRPWIHDESKPRRAGVNAFGFGGIDGHAILEEYRGPNNELDRQLDLAWPSEMLVFSADSDDELAGKLRDVLAVLEVPKQIPLRDIGWSLVNQAGGDHGAKRLAVLAGNADDAKQKLNEAIDRLGNGRAERASGRNGIYYGDSVLAGKVAFLYPGHGGQYLNMFADLARHFPSVRAWFDLMDELLLELVGIRPSNLVFPPPTGWTEQMRDEALRQLFTSDVSIAVTNIPAYAMDELVREKFGLQPDVMMGHSTGEMNALSLSRYFRMGSSREGLIESTKMLADVFMAYKDEIAKMPKTALLTVGAADHDKVDKIIADSQGELEYALDNCPNQVVVFGSEQAVMKARPLFEKAGGICERMPFDRAFHTPAFKGVTKALYHKFPDRAFGRGDVPLMSCVSGKYYPDDAKTVRRWATDMWSQPVRFRESVRRLYHDGVRVFVEVGPNSTLSAFVNDILAGEQHLAVASNSARKGGAEQLESMLAQLFVHGRNPRFEGLYEHREVNEVPLKADEIEIEQPRPTKRVLVRDPASLKLSDSFRKRLQDEYPNRGLKRAPAPEQAPGEGPPVRQPAQPERQQPDQQHPWQPQPAAWGNGYGAPGYDPNMPPVDPYGRPLDANGMPAPPPWDPYAPPPWDPYAQPWDPYAPQGLDPATGQPLPPYDPWAPPYDPYAPLWDPYAPPPFAPDFSQGSTPGMDPTQISRPSGSESPGHGSLTEVKGKGAGPSGETLTEVKGKGEDGAPATAVEKQELIEELEDSSGPEPPDHMLKRFDEEVARNAPMDPRPQVRDLPFARAYPLLGKIVERTADELQCERRFDVTRDRVLKSHAFGGPPSRRQRNLRPMAVVPFVMSLEACAEAAVCLFDGGKFVKSYENIRGHRWLALPRGTLDVQIKARALEQRDGGDVLVRTEIYQYHTNRKGETKPHLTFEANVVVGEREHEPTVPMPFHVTRPRYSHMTTELLYNDGIFYSMHYPGRFHGRHFRAIRNIRHYSPHTIEVEIEVPDWRDLFSDIEDPTFQMDMFVMDAAVLQVGFWYTDTFAMDTNVFPFLIKQAKIFGGPPKPGTKLIGRAALRLTGIGDIELDRKPYCEFLDRDGNVIHTMDEESEGGFEFPDNYYKARLVPPLACLEGSVDVLDAETGRVYAHLVGWQNRVFDIPIRYDKISLFPKYFLMSDRWLQDETGYNLRRNEPFEDGLLEGAWGVWGSKLAHGMLTDAEKDQYYTFAEGDPRREDWLMGRIVAKDALIEWILANTDEERLCPIDIETRIDEHGKPYAICAVNPAIDLPEISLAHSNRWAVAVTSKSGGPIGIDYEWFDRFDYDDVLDGGFHPDDAIRVRELDSGQHPSTVAALWCSKEAAAKAFGTGMDHDPRNWRVTEFDMDAGTATIARDGRSAIARFWFDGDQVVAICELNPDELDEARKHRPGAKPEPRPLMESEPGAGSEIVGELPLAGEEPAAEIDWDDPDREPTELERDLIELWEHILNVDHVGLHDDFFELGGESVLAVRLISRVEKLIGRSIPVANFLKTRTVAQMGQILSDENWTPDWSSLVPVRLVEGRTPLFFAHPVGGNILHYRDLFERLPADQPIYGLQARGLDGVEEPFDNVTEMAEYYLTAIRAAQEEGPYMLLGFSGGGYLAWEMACQLRDAGEQVALLAMFDTFGPGYYSFEIGGSRLPHQLESLIWKLQLHLDTLATLNLKHKLNYLTRKFKHGNWRNRTGTSGAAIRKVEDVTYEAVLNYKPRPYDGKVTLFRASRQPKYSTGDPLLNWEPYVTGEIELHEIYGTHGHLVEVPHVEELAKSLNAVLETTHARIAGAAYA
ncbi:MAG: Phenolphthiocerol synthesis polyketide synthase type I Pks15/1 [Calditrichaeota bacterium]|nr:Phenolphthiocerol synthesis polyketide synthase type I Pks15/1 [Calditrichota bacterium]